jgi:hypothetical protein
VFENGFDTMCMRERCGEELWWTLNLATRGVGGVLMSLRDCMGWGYGRTSGGVGGCFQVIIGLRWEMATMLDFGMNSVVWVQGLKGSLSRFIWYCLCKGRISSS